MLARVMTVGHVTVGRALDGGWGCVLHQQVKVLKRVMTVGHVTMAHALDAGWGWVLPQQEKMLQIVFGDWRVGYQKRIGLQEWVEK